VHRCRLRRGDRRDLELRVHGEAGGRHGPKRGPWWPR
jgi:hypothetical protein